jgi:uncharacterized lipoprotein NlpE involved in copper resistance
MRYQAIAHVLLLAVMAAGTATAGDIYKWTDEEGNVHFGDRPDGEVPEKVAIQSRPTDSARVQATAQARVDAAAKAAEEQAAAAAARQGPTPEELQAQADTRAEKCDTYRERLQKYLTSRRLYRQDENGERVYLDESETQAARERVENQVQKYCST